MPIVYCTELKKPEPEFKEFDAEDGFITIQLENEFTNGIRTGKRMVILKSYYNLNKQKYKNQLRRIFDNSVSDQLKYPTVV